MWGILKKYDINSIDFLHICKYVRNQKLHLIPELIDKYGSYELEKSNVSFDFNGMKSFVIIIFVIIILIVFFKHNNSSSTSSNESSYPVENNNYQRSVEYCSYCGNEISGGGTQQFGKLFCDLRCYADAN
jgi:hypothetical protein